MESGEYMENGNYKRKKQKRNMCGTETQNAGLAIDKTSITQRQGCVQFIVINRMEENVLHQDK